MGVLLTMQQPTGPMRSEAASGGMYSSPWGGEYPRIQIISVPELLGDPPATIKSPPLGQVGATFTKAPRVVGRHPHRRPRVRRAVAVARSSLSSAALAPRCPGPGSALSFLGNLRLLGAGDGQRHNCLSEVPVGETQVRLGELGVPGSGLGLVRRPLELLPQPTNVGEHLGRLLTAVLQSGPARSARRCSMMARLRSYGLSSSTGIGGSGGCGVEAVAGPPC
jgi:hypothetical protein